MRLKRSAAALAIAVLVLLTGCTQTPIDVIPSVSDAGSTPIKVGTAKLPDGATPQAGELLASIYAQALTAAGANAVIVPTDASDPSSLKKLQSGQVDVVPGYSNQLLAAAGHPDPAASKDPMAAMKTTLAPPVEVLNASTAIDTHVVVVTAVTAQKYQLKTITDLAKVCNSLKFAGSADFKTKDRGLSSLASDYNCVPKSYSEKSAQDYSGVQALLSDSVQIAVIQSSSPAIADNALVVLEDTKKLFPAERVVPLVNSAQVTADIREVLNKVTAALTTEELANLNRFSAINNFATPAAAANAWLVQIGLVKATS